MGKSRGNAIALAATADETARLVRSARTDAERHISYDPAARPEVSNLVLLTALCLDASPEGVAASVGGKEAAALKDQLADALIERLRPIRARRSELAGQPGYLRQVLADGAERAQTGAADAHAGPRAGADALRLLTGHGWRLGTGSAVPLRIGPWPGACGSGGRPGG